MRGIGGNMKTGEESKKKRILASMKIIEYGKISLLERQMQVY